MRSNQKSTVSKPRLLRAFQGPVTKNPLHFQGLHPLRRGDDLGPQPHPASPGSQKPRSVAGVDSARFPADAGDRRFTSLTPAAYLLLLRRGPRRTTATASTAAHLLNAIALAAAYLSRAPA
jgi:hypothetical protein